MLEPFKGDLKEDTTLGHVLPDSGGPKDSEGHLMCLCMRVPMGQSVFWERISRESSCRAAPRVLGS